MATKHRVYELAVPDRLEHRTLTIRGNEKVADLFVPWAPRGPQTFRVSRQVAAEALRNQRREGWAVRRGQCPCMAHPKS